MGRLRKYRDNAEKQQAYRKRKKAQRHQVHFSSLLDVRETPADLFAALDAEFDFDTDLAALPHNAKCPRYFTPELDGLRQQWHGVCFLNPPYGTQINAWMAKAWQSAREGATVVCVLPARTDSQWWHDYVMRAEVRFLRGRLRFGGSESSAPFPTAIVIFRPGEPDHTSRSWSWKETS